MTSGWSVNMSVPVQKSGTQYKNYTIIYFVYEKVAQCNQYPPDGQVTFYNIKVEIGGKDVTNDISYTTGYVEDVCNFRAHIVNQSSIQITWNTKLDNGREQEPTKALNEDKVSDQVAKSGMAYREEAPQRNPGMKYRESSGSALGSEGMAYREDPPQQEAEAPQQEAGMAYREDPPQQETETETDEVLLPQREAGMAYREVPREAGMAYREDPPQEAEADEKEQPEEVQEAGMASREEPPLAGMGYREIEN